MVPRSNLLLVVVVGVETSVTRWLDYLFNIWPFRTIKVCPNVKIFAKSLIVNKRPKTTIFLPEWRKFRQLWSHWLERTKGILTLRAIPSNVAASNWSLKQPLNVSRSMIHSVHNLISTFKIVNYDYRLIL